MMRRNSDEDIRRLERLAASGDEAVKARLAGELIRRGRTLADGDLLRALLQEWLKTNKQDHGVRFWSPEEWRQRKEHFANEAGLVMTSEGGWNYVLDGIYPEPDLLAEWDGLIEAAGWNVESETNWCWSFWPKRKNPRRNGDEDLRKLAREAGEGDLLAAERLAAALRRGGGKLEVWVLVALYDLNFVAFRSADTMVESFVFASENDVFEKVEFILRKVIPHLGFGRRDAGVEIEAALGNGQFLDALDLFSGLSFLRGQPVRFYWDKKSVDGS